MIAADNGEDFMLLLTQALHLKSRIYTLEDQDCNIEHKDWSLERGEASRQCLVYAMQYLVLASKHSAEGKLVLTVFGPGLTIRLILPAPVKTTDHKRRRRRLWRWRGPHLPW